MEEKRATHETIQKLFRLIVQKKKSDFGRARAVQQWQIHHRFLSHDGVFVAGSVTFLVKFRMREISHLFEIGGPYFCLRWTVGALSFDSDQHNGPRRPLRFCVLALPVSIACRWCCGKAAKCGAFFWFVGGAKATQPMTTNHSTTRDESGKTSSEVQKWKCCFVRSTPATWTTRQIIRCTLRSYARDQKHGQNNKTSEAEVMIRFGYPPKGK